MKIEHFIFISNHFNLEQYNPYNAPHWWEEEYEGSVLVSEMEIINYPNETGYSVERNIEPNYVVFTGIPTKELAEDILQYIKDTEILFI